MQLKLQFRALKLFMTGENYARLLNEAQKNGTRLWEKHDIRGGTIYKNGFTAQINILGLIYTRF